MRGAWRLRALRERVGLYARYPSLIRWESGCLDNRESLRLAMRWLCRAQDVTGCGGVSAYYSIELGVWALPYRETTGYIIPTFLQYGKFCGDDDYRRRARVMGDWEMEVQRPDGSVCDLECEPGHPDTPKKDGSFGVKVFNTGQVLLGWSRLFEATGERCYLDAAQRAGDWLLRVQDADGGWRQYAPEGANGIHAHVSWPLLELASSSGKEAYRQAAEKNIGWILGQQNEAGWFANSSLEPGKSPWTHAIGYTLGGLAECSLLLKTRQDLLNAVIKGGDALLKFYNEEIPARFRQLPCTFDAQWASKDDHSCLTGNAQIAILWLRLFKVTGDSRYRDAARRIVEQVKATQRTWSLNRNLIGGIAGSDPVNSGYCRFRMINWAAKFYADAVMLLENDKEAQGIH